MRLLLVEDNKRVATALRDALRRSYVVDIEHTGKDALANMNLTSYDIILLDLGLPDMTGQEVCEQLRARKIAAPIIIVSGDSTVGSKVNTLDCGADDYITKPFHAEELKARIRAVLRREAPQKNHSLIVVGDLELDPARRTVRRQNSEITLRRKEFDLLEYMMRNSNRTLTRPMILDHVWENSDGLWTNAVDVHVKYLRDKVDRPYEQQLIKTVHGVGYKLEVQTEGEVAKV
jgi:two-component system OmpR family response regulator